MALDTKKILAKVEGFKKALQSADKQIDEIERAYDKALADQAGLGAAVKEYMVMVARCETTITASLDALKNARKEAKRLTGDVEMTLRRAEDNFDALTKMSEDLVELEQALKKDKTNKDLIRKVDLAEKALEKAMKAADKVAQDAATIETSIYSFEKDGLNIKAFSLGQINELDSLLKHMATVFDDKRRELAAMNKALGR